MEKERISNNNTIMRNQVITLFMTNANDNIVDVNNANGLGPTVNQNTFADDNCQISNPSGLCS